MSCHGYVVYDKSDVHACYKNRACAIKHETNACTEQRACSDSYMSRRAVFTAKNLYANALRALDRHVLV